VTSIFLFLALQATPPSLTTLPDPEPIVVTVDCSVMSSAECESCELESSLECEAKR
jgi:hypothetical protein